MNPKKYPMTCERKNVLFRPQIGPLTSTDEIVEVKSRKKKFWFCQGDNFLNSRHQRARGHSLQLVATVASGSAPGGPAAPPVLVTLPDPVTNTEKWTLNDRSCSCNNQNRGQAEQTFVTMGGASACSEMEMSITPCLFKFEGGEQKEQDVPGPAT